MFAELIKKNRSYRRFHEDVPIPMETLHELVGFTRYCASAANLQPLKYMVCCDPENNARVFKHLAWAGYLKDWNGPSRGERPAAYIIILGDTTISKTFGCDHGIAGQTILLGATEKGLGGCFIGAVKRKALRDSFHIPDHLDILLVLALGKPKEQVAIDDVDEKGNIQYWRDDQQVHHVPKRRLEDILI
jgi:nitroreductase